MNLRPTRAIWFELLTTHDELADTLEALAQTGTIELEMHDHISMQMDLQDLQLRLQEYNQLERYYKPTWPIADTGMSPFEGSPAEILDKALACLYDWEKQAQPTIQKLAVINRRLNDYRLLQDVLASDEASGFDYQLLTSKGSLISARLFLLPSKSRLDSVPSTILWKEISTDAHKYLLLVGTANDLDALTAELAIKKYTPVQLPALPSQRQDALQAVITERSRLETYAEQLQREIDGLAGPLHLSQALGEIIRLKWFVSNVSSLPVSSNFAWITGWTSNLDGKRLSKALELRLSHAILHFPENPADTAPPMIFQNPWWAKPFEFFAGLLGTPGNNEADPSRFLAVIAPLLFGYMFGDVGQGCILLLAGILLQKRWPLLRILVANGASAVLFGFVFGSVFGREDLIPALWVHPVQHPLPVLAVPLIAGVLIILLGMILNACESRWRGEWLRWLHVDAPVVALYLGIISLSFLAIQTSLLIIASALTWYFIGNLLLSRGNVMAMVASIATLVETAMQLILNTVSFVRVGAFALAHAGLSLAFNIMAESTGSVVISILILLLGNIIVIVLEGLVVSIQTTRLILFEFFIRFLQANGRVFKPLSGPLTGNVSS
ncbi:MAG: V-type ATPase 116kDa subunit family protein [Gammaproteobacteria bacterium]|jgi:V/A-type H+-transporting ATPase subunit I